MCPVFKIIRFLFKELISIVFIVINLGAYNHYGMDRIPFFSGPVYRLHCIYISNQHTISDNLSINMTISWAFIINPISLYILFYSIFCNLDTSTNMTVLVTELLEAILDLILFEILFFPFCTLKSNETFLWWCLYVINALITYLSNSSSKSMFFYFHMRNNKTTKQRNCVTKRRCETTKERCETAKVKTTKQRKFETMKGWCERARFQTAKQRKCSIRTPHDPLIQLSEHHSDLTKRGLTIFKSCWLMSHFILSLPCLKCGTYCANKIKWMDRLSHTLCCGFHYETYIDISPYRTLAVDWA